MPRRPDMLMLYPRVFERMRRILHEVFQWKETTDLGERIRRGHVISEATEYVVLYLKIFEGITVNLATPKFTSALLAYLVYHDEKLRKEGKLAP